MAAPTATAQPLAEGLFTWPSESPRLLGSRCEVCSTYTFPTHYGCPRCSSDQMTTVELGTTGTIWTWTSQEFRPPAPYSGPDEFTPYFVGYVELPELIVEAYLTGYTLERPPTIGDRVEFGIVPFGTRPGADDDTIDVVTYAFGPTTTSPEGEPS